MKQVLAMVLALMSGLVLRSEGVPAVTDGEIWNEGVTFFRAGDVTNALRVLKPLMLSKTHGARAAEVVAKLAMDAEDPETAAAAAQIALRAAPDDPRANRNFTRTIDRLPRLREERHVAEVLKGAQGRDPGTMLQKATHEARALMEAAGGCHTNRAERAVALADALSARARGLTDVWIPVRQHIAQAATNEEQASTILQQLEQAQAKTRKAAGQLADLEASAYSSLSDVEHDFTRFLKLTAMPPAALAEDIVAQTNAWMDVEAFNGRSWQKDALDYTRAFRARFPAWAKAYEQQAQADTNRPPFTAEDQAKISALSTELEKLQLECAEKSVPFQQEKALGLLRQIQELMPKDGNSGQNQQQNDQQQNQQQNPQQTQQPNQQQDNQQPNQQQEQEPRSDEKQDEKQPSEGEDADDPKQDSDVEAVLKKAQERSDEHEAEKKARMRKAPLPPNERDW